MAKRKQVSEECYGECPLTLNGENFYGYTLDEDQLNFANAILNPNIDFVACESKAGSGKNLVSIGVANMLVQYKRFERVLYVTSPCMEYRAGFLPGDLSQKASVYYSPLYEAMESLGINPFTAIIDDSLVAQKYQQNGWIKPLTSLYLRGCNLDKSIIVCDECQNATFQDLTKILTRVGKDSKIVLIGNLIQNDLRDKSQSGFSRFLEHFKNKNDSRAAFCTLTKCYRSWIADWADQCPE